MKEGQGREQKERKNIPPSKNITPSKILNAFKLIHS
jgi:hypothetical protein